MQTGMSYSKRVEADAQRYKWNAHVGLSKLQQTKDGTTLCRGYWRSAWRTREEGKLSQFLVAANRIAFIDPANGNANADVCWCRAIRYS